MCVYKKELKSPPALVTLLLETELKEKCICIVNLLFYILQDLIMAEEKDMAGTSRTKKYFFYYIVHMLGRHFFFQLRRYPSSEL